jgi:hypothetical protein
MDATVNRKMNIQLIWDRMKRNRAGLAKIRSKNEEKRRENV